MEGRRLGRGRVGEGSGRGRFRSFILEWKTVLPYPAERIGGS